EQRNLQAFLELVASGSIRPSLLTTHRFPIDRATEAFELMLRGKEPYLGIILTYPTRETTPPRRIELPTVLQPIRKATLGVSFIGAGNFAQGVLLPILKKLPQVQFRGIVTASGVTAQTVGRKYGFVWAATDPEEAFRDTGTDVVFIVTRHSQHAPMVCAALRAGKAVFCEKPLAITMEQLLDVQRALEETGGRLMVGFNRRFAPLAQKLKEFLQGRGPLSVTYRVNAGLIPPDHWLADPAEGGRIIGEACHFFDFFAFLTDSEPTDLQRLSPNGVSPRDDGQFLVRYKDGSVCHLIYTTTGSPGFSKERIEVHAGGCSAVLEDFKTLLLDDGSRRYRKKLWTADKGHEAAVRAFLHSLNDSWAAMSRESLIQVTFTTMWAAGAAQSFRGS
ncbi:MAG: Gfo/Idh/MocA family oxidoreductase, partial [Armatimonadota bacterium]